MEELTPGPLPQITPQRPTLLTVLCILTFISSGMNMFSSFFISGFYDTFVEVVKVLAEKFKLPGMDALLDAKPLFYLVTGFFYAGSVTGAFLMFRLKKSGFHVYTVFQILLILAPMYFMHLASPDFTSILFAGLFILLYSMNLKFMS